MTNMLTVLRIKLMKRIFRGPIALAARPVAKRPALENAVKTPQGQLLLWKTDRESRCEKG